MTVAGVCARSPADLELLGVLFESPVVRNLRVLAEALDGQVFHHRDDHGVEVDAVLQQLGDGRWGAVEPELGDGLVGRGGSSLLRFLRPSTGRCGARRSRRSSAAMATATRPTRACPSSRWRWRPDLESRRGWDIGQTRRA